ncbi:hypothetical protein B0H10DRAFT_1957105 [Mycena sp. CBHHK59/15]|nr:hypothetical protein B0H10DRAFT_1957105 [Mycena sp. CBHHK59/15]
MSFMPDDPFEDEDLFLWDPDIEQQEPLESDRSESDDSDFDPGAEVWSADGSDSDSDEELDAHDGQTRQTPPAIQVQHTADLRARLGDTLVAKTPSGYLESVLMIKTLTMFLKDEDFPIPATLDDGSVDASGLPTGLLSLAGEQSTAHSCCSPPQASEWRNHVTGTKTRAPVVRDEADLSTGESNDLQDFADAIPDTHGLMIHAVWQGLPPIIRCQISLNHASWESFCNVLQELRLDIETVPPLYMHTQSLLVLLLSPLLWSAGFHLLPRSNRWCQPSVQGLPLPGSDKIWPIWAQNLDPVRTKMGGLTMSGWFRFGQNLAAGGGCRQSFVSQILQNWTFQRENVESARKSPSISQREILGIFSFIGAGKLPVLEDYGMLGKIQFGQKLGHLRKIGSDKNQLFGGGRDLASKGIIRGPGKSNQPFDGSRDLLPRFHHDPAEIETLKNSSQLVARRVARHRRNATAVMLRHDTQ